MNLEKLLVTQDGLRHWASVQEMADYVRSGGFWTADYLAKFSRQYKLSRTSPVIALSRFEDGLVYVHDGHHRCVATYLGGRNYLREDEYGLTDWLYSQYTETNHRNGWYTPFDPRTHLRTANFANFKRQARRLYTADPVHAEEWVRENASLYLSAGRAVTTVADLARLAWAPT